MYMLTEYCQLTLGKVVLSKGLDGRKKVVFFFNYKGNENLLKFINIQ